MSNNNKDIFNGKIVELFAGYGFIDWEGAKIFFPFSNIIHRRPLQAPLRVNDSVRFTLEETSFAKHKGKLTAFNVAPVVVT